MPREPGDLSTGLEGRTSRTYVGSCETSVSLEPFSPGKTRLLSERASPSRLSARSLTMSEMRSTSRRSRFFGVPSTPPGAGTSAYPKTSAGAE
jgi:hypothetical protein